MSQIRLKTKTIEDATGAVIGDRLSINVYGGNIRELCTAFLDEEETAYIEIDKGYKVETAEGYTELIGVIRIGGGNQIQITMGKGGE